MTHRLPHQVPRQHPVPTVHIKPVWVYIACACVCEWESVCVWVSLPFRKKKKKEKTKWNKTTTNHPNQATVSRPHGGVVSEQGWTWGLSDCRCPFYKVACGWELLMAVGSGGPRRRCDGDSKVFKYKIFLETSTLVQKYCCWAFWWAGYEVQVEGKSELIVFN